MPRFFDFFKKFCYNIYTVKKEMRKKPMKINYERTVPITPKLYEVRPGELFRPNHADQVFMRTTSNGSDEFTSEKEAPLRKMFMDIQSAYKNDEEIDYESLIFCVDMETGKLVLLDSSLKVEKLIGELMIKER
jgi:hypothetical protein